MRDWRHVTTCSAFNRGAMVEANHAAKALMRELGQRYGASSVNSDIDEHNAQARYKVSVPFARIAPVLVAIRRRNARRI